MYRFGEILILPFSYTDLQSSKRRPALVLVDTDDEDVLVAKVTTKEYGSPYDISLPDWKMEGLRAPSFVRLHKLLAVEKTHIIERIGMLSAADMERVRDAFHRMI